MAAKLYIGKR